MRYLLIVILVLAFSTAALAQTRQAEVFTAVDLNGKTVDLNALKGKVVLLTFWSTRCAICHTEIPKLNRIAAGYADSDVVFLAATMENEEKVESYLKRNPFHFDILPNSFGLVLKYARKDGKGNIAMGFPAYFLIDQDGKIEYQSSGWDQARPLDAAINKLRAKR
ncbi:hypothetical protein BH20ACI2_BH20ACI2_27670 [soil metagenome]